MLPPFVVRQEDLVDPHQVFWERHVLAIRDPCDQFTGDHPELSTGRRIKKEGAKVHTGFTQIFPWAALFEVLGCNRREPRPERV